jgi:hypothetical protein
MTHKSEPYDPNPAYGLEPYPVRAYKLERVVDAAVAYCEATNPNGDPLDYGLRAAVGELARDWALPDERS